MTGAKGRKHFFRGQWFPISNTDLRTEFEAVQHSGDLVAKHEPTKWHYKLRENEKPNWSELRS